MLTPEKTSATPTPSPRAKEQPVQRKAARQPVQASGELATSGVHEAAARGTSGGGGSMPHADKIGAAFGHHSLSGVQAHVGGAASQACADMGASAYASGNNVAFKSSPDLHTAAHEAAHVVQQRSGVSLNGGVGQSGDHYEKHADQVADAVVSGKSATGLLDSMTGGGGKSGVQGKFDAIAVQRDEEQGAWLQQQTLTKDSFFDLIRQNFIAVDEWEAIAAVEDPPPAWQTALMVIGTVALAAALGGVGGVVAGKLLSEGAKMVTHFIVNAAIDAGKKAVETGVGMAVSTAGAGDGAALKAFCNTQRYGMSDASKTARETFVTKSGTHTGQRMTIAQMQSIKAANDASFQEAKSIQHHEMLANWMNMLAGKDNAKNSTDGLEDTSVKGVLGLVIKGASDNPTQIVRAETEGVNESLRNQLTGTKVSDWAPRPGKPGINIRIRTEENGYTVTNATKDRIKAAGQWPGWGTTADASGSIYFAAAVQPDGAEYQDTDKDWSNDFNWGADAGRWFLNNVKSGTQIIADLGRFRIPSVGT